MQTLLICALRRPDACCIATRLFQARASPPLILEQHVAKLSVDEHRLCILMQAMPVRHAAVKNQLQDVRRMLRAAGRAGGGLRSLSATRP